jgi:hypothetical protein
VKLWVLETRVCETLGFRNPGFWKPGFAGPDGALRISSSLGAAMAPSPPLLALLLALLSHVLLVRAVTGMSDILNPTSKNENFQRVLSMAQSSLPYPIELKHDPRSRPVDPNTKYLILTVAMEKTYITNDMANFAGTARRTGFGGDITIAISPESNPNFIARALNFSTTLFTVGSSCSGATNAVCTYRDHKIPLSMLRIYIYSNLLQLYPPSTIVFITDFRDVFFQTNPFLFKPASVLTTPSQLLLFSEAYPNRIVSRCHVATAMIMNCYGRDMLNLLGAQVISTSMNAIGNKDTILVYVSIIYNSI